MKDIKIVVNKLVGDLGEQWAIEFTVPAQVLKEGGPEGPVKAIKAMAEPALRVVDDRLLELNMRLINHNRAAQTLAPEGLLAVRQCVEIMYGRRQPGTEPQMQENPGNETVVSEPAQKAEKAANALERALDGVDQGA